MGKNQDSNKAPGNEAAEVKERVMVDYSDIGGKYGKGLDAMFALMIKDGYKQELVTPLSAEIDKNVGTIMAKIKTLIDPMEMLDAMEDLKTEQGKKDNLHLSALQEFFNDTLVPFTGKTTRKMGVSAWADGEKLAVYFGQCRNERKEQWSEDSVVLVHNDLLTAGQWAQVELPKALDKLDTPIWEVENNVHAFSVNFTANTFVYRDSTGTVDSHSHAAKNVRVKMLGNNSNHGIHTTGYDPDKAELILPDEKMVALLLPNGTDPK